MNRFMCVALFFGIAACLVACAPSDSQGGTAAESLNSVSSRIQITVTEAFPLTVNLSDAEIIALFTEARGERSSSSGNASPRRLTLSQARETMNNVWFPSYLPEAYSEDVAIIITRDVEAGSGRANETPDSIVILGFDGSVLTIRSVWAKADSGSGPLWNVPVGVDSATNVQIDRQLSGTLIHGEWFTQMNREQVTATQRWDPEGAKRLLFERDGILFDVDVKPAAALSDQQLNRLE